MRWKFLFLSPLLLSVFFVHAQWHLSNDGLSNPGVFSFFVNGDNLFVGTNVGVCLSTDNALHWTPVSSSAPVSALAGDGTNIFAATPGDGITRSSDNGDSWDPVNTGLTSEEVYALIMKEDLVFAGTTGGVFVSDNNGDAWEITNTGLTNTDVRAFAFDGMYLFAGTNGGGIFRSPDNGANWTHANTGLPATAWVRALLFSGTNLFAATDQGVYLSTDDGDAWSAVNSGLGSTNVFSLALHGLQLFAATEANGVFTTINNGMEWTDINSGFPADPGIGFALAINATNIFAAMYSNGVYTRAFSEIDAIQQITGGDVQIFPNPAQNKLHIINPTSGSFRYVLYNASGMKITDRYADGNEITVAVKSWPSGMYFCEIFSGNGTITAGRFVHL